MTSPFLIYIALVVTAVILLGMVAFAILCDSFTAQQENGEDKE